MILLKLVRRLVGGIKNLRRNIVVLGIETSCDDTSCSVVRSNREILGESTMTQKIGWCHSMACTQRTCSPPRFMHFRSARACEMFNTSKTSAACRATEFVSSVLDIDFVAVTNRPGLGVCLRVGVEYAKALCKRFNKPLIAVHHLEAHALTMRLLRADIQFPFLLLLVSGGHCILALVERCNRFVKLGSTVDIAPGEAFDKLSRHYALNSRPDCAGLSGGEAIERMAEQYLLTAHDVSLHPMMLHGIGRRNCDFTYSGLVTAFQRRFDDQNNPILTTSGSEVGRLCAEFQFTLLLQIAYKVMLAGELCFAKRLLKRSAPNLLVVSGGVASNKMLMEGLSSILATSDHGAWEVTAPPPRLCADNGTMIAWTALEYLAAEVADPFSGQRLDDVPVLPSKSSEFGLDFRHHDQLGEIESSVPDFVRPRIARIIQFPRYRICRAV